MYMKLILKVICEKKQEGDLYAHIAQNDENLKWEAHCGHTNRMYLDYCALNQ